MRTIAEIDIDKERIGTDQNRRADEQLDGSDCALSTWADGINQSKLSIERALVESGGMASFLALQTVDGQPVAARMIDGRYGMCWALCGPDGKFTGTFLPVCDSAVEPGLPYVSNDAKLQRKGYRQVAVLRPAVARIVGRGHGLSGTAQACAVDAVTGQGSCAWEPTINA